MINKWLAIMGIAAVIASSLSAGTVPPDSTIFPGQTGMTLINSLIAAYHSTSNLGYDRARDTMYGVVDKKNDTLECVYSGYKIYMQPGQDPSTWAYDHDFNCEHSWPQSMLNSGTAVSDLHHLYPTDIEVNGARDNDPFSDIPDAQTVTWYYNNTTSSTIPSSNIDLYAEEASGTFEPREAQKGNTARSLYYMLTMWQLGDTDLAWWTGQKNTLYAWHVNDPANAAEITRTRKIATYQQGKVNPFVLDSTLIRRCYYPTTTTFTRVNFASTALTKNESDGTAILVVSISNPSGSAATTAEVVLTGGSGTAADVGNYVTKTLTFPAGSTASRNDTITITDDAIEEGTETLVFRLRNVTGGNSAAAGSDSVLTLTLTDNDDATAPSITAGPSASGVTASAATIAWTTNEISNSWVYYGLTTAYSDTFMNETDVTSHSIGLSELAASTIYHYKVSSTDPMNNGPTYSGDNTFTTSDTGSSSGPPWIYNFGTGTGSFTSGVSTTFLPQPQTGGGDSARVRIGTGAGSFNMENPGLSNFGAATELRAVAPTGGSVNKFSIYNYTAGKSYTIKYTVRFGGGSPGRWYFFQGDGAMYSDNNTFSGAQIFTGLRWAFGSSSSCTTSYRNAGSWTILNGVMNAQGVDYTVEIYGNNSDSLTKTTYTYSHGTTQSIAPNKFDLWVNGTLVGDDLQKGQLTNNLNIDSWMFYGESSTGNVATIYLDDFIYTNQIASSPLAVTLGSFTCTARNDVITIRWRTESEANTYRWIIERATNGAGPFVRQAELAAAGSSSQPREYSWNDRNIVGGKTYYYRLCQQDLSGGISYYGPVSVTATPAASPTLGLHAYPNPFRHTTAIKYQLAAAQQVELCIYNAAGQLVRTIGNAPGNSGSNSAGWDGLDLQGRGVVPGVYFYRLTAGAATHCGRVVIIK